MRIDYLSANVHISCLNLAIGARNKLGRDSKVGCTLVLRCSQLVHKKEVSSVLENAIAFPAKVSRKQFTP